MSIWGTGPFDNDDGADWFAELRDAPRLQAIQEAVEEIAQPGHVGYIEITDGAEAVAAAEVLAELLGSSGEEPLIDEDLGEFFAALRAEIGRERPLDVETLVRQAVDALEIIVNDAENSELLQVWEERPGDAPAWRSAVAALQDRLRRVS